MFSNKMATSLHVKEKSAWKTVSIPKDLLSQEEFDGLVDIQELTDYEFVSVNTEVSFFSKISQQLDLMI